MEIKKPANPWELLPGAPSPQASETLVSAIRIDVAVEGEIKPINNQEIIPPSRLETQAVRAQTPLPTRRKFGPNRQFSK